MALEQRGLKAETRRISRLCLLSPVFHSGIRPLRNWHDSSALSYYKCTNTRDSRFWHTSFPHSNALTQAPTFQSSIRFTFPYFSFWAATCIPASTVKLLNGFFLVCFLSIAAARAEQIALTDVSRLVLKNTQADVNTYLGKPALRLTEKGSGEALAILKNVRFHNGTIDLEVSGAPAKNAPEAARGFIGIAFRMQDDGARFENFYIRPTNGRADDQLRRNHTTQYESKPDWPWDRLRKETPGVYESYADIVAGEWTHLRIVVQGKNASLFVGDATQPCLLVHDLKLGDTEGAVALWVGPGTDGYFGQLTINSAK
jgi:hypothetical protein